MDPLDAYEKIVNEFEQKPEVEKGKMMSSPGLKYKGKVFAFYHDEQMGFKLGEEFAPDTYGIEKWGYLSPFKNKPPMRAWFMVPSSESRHWETLANLALENMQD
ncbi:MAG: hypothetical protein R2879_14885 [Saprospiraceae bacterium]